MQATIIAPGSRGDVQPYVALGAGLRLAGHTVHLLASADYRELVEAHELTFYDMGGSIQATTQRMEGVLEQGNMLKILRSMGPAAQELAQGAATGGLAACAGSDVVIAGLAGLFVGLALAQKLDIPFVPAYLYPFTPTHAFPAVLAPPLPLPLPAAANPLTHRLTQQMMWQTFRAADNQIRRQVLQLDPAPFRGPFAALERAGRLTLCGYSPNVIPVPGDWPGTIHVTGYWFLDPPVGWEEPPELTRFLQSGPPPVYIGFGSMVNRRPGQVVQLVLDALGRTGQRAVVSGTDWAGVRPGDLPATVHAIGSTPHSRLFPQMAAVVHHGGAGTTAAALRAGVPAVVTPFFGDQPFWADRVYRLGAGPQPIPRRRLTAERLAQAIAIAVTDSAMRERAAALGNTIRAEDGVGRAVALLEG